MGISYDPRSIPTKEAIFHPADTLTFLLEERPVGTAQLLLCRPG